MGPAGEPEKGLFTGTFDRKIKCISGFLSRSQWILRFYIWGPSGTLVKEQGSPELIADYGTQRTCL
jgi:hypothetical protein